MKVEPTVAFKILARSGLKLVSTNSFKEKINGHYKIVYAKLTILIENCEHLFLVHKYYVQ